MTSGVIPTMRYENANDAIEWLCDVLGFRKQIVVPGQNGTIAHAQLRLGDGMIMLSSDANSADSEYGQLIKKPALSAGLRRKPRTLWCPTRTPSTPG